MPDGLVPVSIGRVTVDADLRVARIVHWLLKHQALVADDTMRLIIHTRGRSIKYELITFHEDRDAE